MMNELRFIEPLSAYGEYTEEDVAITEQKVWKQQNHLSDALSPYLQLHASDPTDWYEWGAEAFETARALDKPVLVSIGFYSEHWCRRMHSECFADPETAEAVNDACIPVCVDAEERPDIAELFMETCRLQSGSAGWPLTIMLDERGRPFFVATYLPKRTMGQMPGLTEILPRVKWLWHVQRQDVDREAGSLVSLTNNKLKELSSGGRRGRLSNTPYEAVNDLRKVFDVQWGGWGGPQKFPEAVKMIFLLTAAAHNKGLNQRDKSDAMTMTDVTLRRMWRGGIHDHLGGGFSRYAADERWLLPHYEKLLSLQALLLYSVSLAQELNNSNFHKMFAEDIVSCVLKYFALDESYSQAFKSSVCGDVADNEGRYYLWTEGDIKHVLQEGDAALFCLAYGVLPGGNFGSELGGSQIAQNILYEASTVTNLAKRSGLRAAEVASRLHVSRNTLLDFRDKRYQLDADDKVVMSYNGLMIAALSKAAIVFEMPAWREIAERTALFLSKSLRNKDGKYHRLWLNGRLSTSALAEDYAYFLWGIVELYKAAKHFNAGEKQLGDWLNLAKNVSEEFIASYWDDKQGGFVLSDKNDKCLFVQMKFGNDINSLPNANAIAAIVFSELGIILEDKKYSDYARKIIDGFSDYARDNPVNALTMITAEMLYKPVTVKPVEPTPVLTDEELNAEPNPEQFEAPSQPKPPARTTARHTSSRQERRRRTSRTREK